MAHCVLLVSTDYTGIATDTRINDLILYGALLRVLFEAPFASTVVNVLKASVSRVIAICMLIITFTVRDDNFRETIRYSLQGIALFPLFSIVLLDRPTVIIRRVLSSPMMVLIGRLSYSMYLFHLLARTPAEVIFGSPYRVKLIASGLFLTGSSWRI